MPTDHQVALAISQALAALTRFNDGERTPQRFAMFKAEIELLACQVAEWDCDTDEMENRIILPVEDGLLERHGYEVGPRQLDEFLTSFEGSHQRRTP